MSDLAVVISAFPRHELIIRRLHAQMPEFRNACDDYATARCARDRWKTDPIKAKEFTQLLVEIGWEIEDYIDNALNSLREERRK